MPMPQEVREFHTFAEVMVANEKRTGTIEELSKMMHDVAAAVRKTGKKGTVSLKIEIACDKNDELALTFQATPSCSLPTPDRRKALIYHNPETNTFTKTDPRQLELLAEQDAERTEREQRLREANIAQLGRGPVIEHEATGTNG
jgi:hypothetical protein